LTDPAAQAAQHQAAELTMKLLGRDAEPPGLRAARSVLAKINA
jgi:lipid-A-disaccharide synthase